MGLEFSPKLTQNLNFKNALLLQGLPTLFPWPSKKCYEASPQEIHGLMLITRQNGHSIQTIESLNSNDRLNRVNQSNEPRPIFIP